MLHPHAYIDRDPPADGDPVPLDDATIAHSASDTIVLTDLEAGQHTFWVVGADTLDNVVAPPEPIRVDVTIE